MKALEIRPAPEGVTKDNMWAVSEYKVPGLYEVEGQLLSFNGVCVTTLGMIGLFPTTGVPELAQIEAPAPSAGIGANDLLKLVAIIGKPELSLELCK